MFTNYSKNSVTSAYFITGKQESLHKKSTYYLAGYIRTVSLLLKKLTQVYSVHFYKTNTQIIIHLLSAKLYLLYIIIILQVHQC
ncbi:hypothetical protein ALT721_1310049 [Alteromonas alvinellae]